MIGKYEYMSHSWPRELMLLAYDKNPILHLVLFDKFNMITELPEYETTKYSMKWTMNKKLIPYWDWHSFLLFILFRLKLLESWPTLVTFHAYLFLTQISVYLNLLVP